MNEDDARKQLAEVCRLTYWRGYVGGLEGNLSIRINESEILSTPASTCKGRVAPEHFIVTDTTGNQLRTPPHARGGRAKPSSELAMHIIAYKLRPDIRAIVHAHPIVATGFTVAGVQMHKCVLPEVVTTVGIVPTAPYATPSTEEVPISIAALLSKHDLILLDHHGALAVGRDIWDAFYKIEMLENMARTSLAAHQLGNVKALKSAQVKKLIDIRGVYGFTNPLPVEKMLSRDCSAPDSE
jgi:L-fuculose-phosphate aldolase